MEKVNISQIKEYTIVDSIKMGNSKGNVKFSLKTKADFRDKQKTECFREFLLQFMAALFLENLT